jgi:hypothetical protein
MPETDVDYCRDSKRRDKPLRHSWEFDGDSPRTRCVYCGQVRDALTGDVISPRAVEPEAIHGWFGLTYANYLVLPRSLLQSMPDVWQASFVAHLEQLRDLYGGLDWPASYSVQARDEDGRFTTDSIPHYRRGRTRVDPVGAQR